MAYKVRTTFSYDARFEQALAYRLEYAGRVSASRLLAEQDRIETQLASFPRMGVPLDVTTTEPDSDILRWVRLGNYIAVYETYSKEELVVLEDLFYASENWRKKIRLARKSHEE